MRKIIVFNLITVDGFFPGPNGEIDWHNYDDEMGRHSVEQMKSLGALIFGKTTYELMASFHWINSYSALMFPFFASTTGILLFRQFFLTVPRDMTDAARMDGAGPLRYFLDILVPLSRTNIAALFVIEFIYMWSQYLWPLIVTNTEDMRVVQIGIKMLIATDQISPAWNVIMAGTIIAMLPPLVVLMVFRKSFAEGIAMQSQK